MQAITTDHLFVIMLNARICVPLIVSFRQRCIKIPKVALVVRDYAARQV